MFASHSNRQRIPEGPPRRRSSSTSQAGMPGAPPGSGTEGAGRTIQRLCAALARGTALPRRTISKI
ncbi:MAG: hypothetical protein P8Y58_03910 [Novosphingobium sp.]